MATTLHPHFSQVKEFIVLLKDDLVEFFLDNSKVRSVSNQTNCYVELTNRILNRKLGDYRIIKYVIIQIKGRDASSIRQCNKLIENRCSSYRNRQEYIKKVNCCTVYNDEFLPDNTDLYFQSQRSGTTTSQYGCLSVRSPYEISAKRPIKDCLWKVDDPNLAKGMIINSNKSSGQIIERFFGNSIPEKKGFSNDFYPGTLRVGFEKDFKVDYNSQDYQEYYSTNRSKLLDNTETKLVDPKLFINLCQDKTKLRNECEGKLNVTMDNSKKMKTLTSDKMITNTDTVSNRILHDEYKKPIDEPTLKLKDLDFGRMEIETTAIAGGGSLQDSSIEAIGINEVEEKMPRLVKSTSYFRHYGERFYDPQHRTEHLIDILGKTIVPLNAVDSFGKVYADEIAEHILFEEAFKTQKQAFDVSSKYDQLKPITNKEKQELTNDAEVIVESVVSGASEIVNISEEQIDDIVLKNVLIEVHCAFEESTILQFRKDVNVIGTMDSEKHSTDNYIHGDQIQQYSKVEVGVDVDKPNENSKQISVGNTKDVSKKGKLKLSSTSISQNTPNSQSLKRKGSKHSKEHDVKHEKDDSELEEDLEEDKANSEVFVEYNEKNPDNRSSENVILQKEITSAYDMETKKSLDQKPENSTEDNKINDRNIGTSKKISVENDKTSSQKNEVLKNEISNIQSTDQNSVMSKRTSTDDNKTLDKSIKNVDLKGDADISGRKSENSKRSSIESNKILELKSEVSSQKSAKLFDQNNIKRSLSSSEKNSKNSNEKIIETKPESKSSVIKEDSPGKMPAVIQKKSSVDSFPIRNQKSSKDINLEKKNYLENSHKIEDKPMRSSKKSIDLNMRGSGSKLNTISSKYSSENKTDSPLLEAIRRFSNGQLPEDLLAPNKARNSEKMKELVVDYKRDKHKQEELLGSSKANSSSEKDSKNSKTNEEPHNSNKAVDNKLRNFEEEDINGIEENLFVSIVDNPTELLSLIEVQRNSFDRENEKSLEKENNKFENRGEHSHKQNINEIEEEQGAKEQNVDLEVDLEESKFSGKSNIKSQATATDHVKMNDNSDDEENKKELDQENSQTVVSEFETNKSHSVEYDIENFREDEKGNFVKIFAQIKNDHIQEVHVEVKFKNPSNEIIKIENDSEKNQKTIKANIPLNSLVEKLENIPIENQENIRLENLEASCVKFIINDESTKSISTKSPEITTTNQNDHPVGSNVTNDSDIHKTIDPEELSTTHYDNKPDQIDTCETFKLDDNSQDLSKTPHDLVEENKNKLSEKEDLTYESFPQQDKEKYFEIDIVSSEIVSKSNLKKFDDTENRTYPGENMVKISSKETIVSDNSVQKYNKYDQNIQNEALELSSDKVISSEQLVTDKNNKIYENDYVEFNSKTHDNKLNVDKEYALEKVPRAANKLFDTMTDKDITITSDSVLRMKNDHIESEKKDIKIKSLLKDHLLRKSIESNDDIKYQMQNTMKQFKNNPDAYKLVDFDDNGINYVIEKLSNTVLTTVNCNLDDMNDPPNFYPEVKSVTSTSQSSVTLFSLNLEIPINSNILLNDTKAIQQVNDPTTNTNNSMNFNNYKNAKADFNGHTNKFSFSAVPSNIYGCLQKFDNEKVTSPSSPVSFTESSIMDFAEIKELYIKHSSIYSMISMESLKHQLIPVVQRFTTNFQMSIMLDKIYIKTVLLRSNEIFYKAKSINLINVNPVNLNLLNMRANQISMDDHWLFSDRYFVLIDFAVLSIVETKCYQFSQNILISKPWNCKTSIIRKSISSRTNSISISSNLFFKKNNVNINILNRTNYSDNNTNLLTINSPDSCLTKDNIDMCLRRPSIHKLSGLVRRKTSSYDLSNQIRRIYLRNWNGSHIKRRPKVAQRGKSLDSNPPSEITVDKVASWIINNRDNWS